MYTIHSVYSILPYPEVIIYTAAKKSLPCKEKSRLPKGVREFNLNAQNISRRQSMTAEDMEIVKAMPIMYKNPLPFSSKGTGTFMPKKLDTTVGIARMMVMAARNFITRF